MFSPTLINLGIVKVGTQYKMDFDFGVEVSYVKTIDSPCDCTSVDVDRINRKVVVKYIPKPIPKHLLSEGKSSYDITKVVEIGYINVGGANLKQNLVFTATVKK